MEQRWAIMLAAGDGTRLRRLTTLGQVPVPKQFCLVDDGASLLDLAIERAQRVVPPSNVVPIVAEAHREFWSRELALLPPDNVIVQPSNRGTAAGVLLPLLAIHGRDPEASVLLVPSDHYVEHEDLLAERIEVAFQEVEHDREAIVLVGVEAETPDPGFGWIVPAPDAAGPLRRVAAFIEKPNAIRALELMRGGAVVNTLLIVASVKALLALYRRRIPGLLCGLRSALAAERLFPGAVRAYYADLTPADFSRNLLQGAEETLLLMVAPACGWNDLGTPERVAACVERLPRGRRDPSGVRARTGRVDLLRAVDAEV